MGSISEKKFKLMSVLCTRPSAIKMAPIVHALRKNNQIDSIVCVTGQHREMLDQVLKLFYITPDLDLNIMSANQDLTTVTTRVLEGMKKALTDFAPDLVLVQGDTTSTMASALASFYQKIPVCHVEAGLRTNQLYAPFPEEVNRVITSRIACCHFAPTATAKQNLLSENIPEENIYVTGNTVIDSLLWVRNKVNQINDWSSALGYKIQELIDHCNPIILITGHRRENFGDGFEKICNAFRLLAERHPDWHFVYPVHLNPHVQKPVRQILSALNNFHLINPLEYLPFVYLMDKAKIIITDSGGIQEEAPSLGKPVLVTRDVTERPEGVDAGVVILVGSSVEKIIQEVELLMQDDERYHQMSHIANPYGDGSSAQRIVNIITEKFIRRHATCVESSFSEAVA